MREHTTPKIWLRSTLAEYEMLSTEDHQFLLQFCENNRQELSEGKWKKLFALIRNLATQTYINFCGYETTDGRVFDITIHEMFDTAPDIVVSKPADRMTFLKDDIACIESKLIDLEKMLKLRKKELSELMAPFMLATMTGDNHR